MDDLRNDAVEVSLDSIIGMVLEVLGEDIDQTVKAFIRKYNLPQHLEEDMLQEAYILIATSMHKYDYTKSALRTYVINTTRISCLRYRTYYFKLYTPDWEIEEEYIESSTSRTVEDVIDDLGIEGLNKEVLLDRVHGKSLVEISEDRDISVRQVYKIFDNFEKVYKEST